VVEAFRLLLLLLLVRAFVCCQRFRLEAFQWLQIPVEMDFGVFVVPLGRGRRFNLIINLRVVLLSSQQSIEPRISLNIQLKATRIVFIVFAQTATNFHLKLSSQKKLAGLLNFACLSFKVVGMRMETFN